MNLKVYILSVVSNIANLQHLEMAKKYYETCTGHVCNYTYARKTYHKLNVRKGQKLGFTHKIYGEKNIIKYMMLHKNLVCNKNSIDAYGNLCIGVSEYNQNSVIKYTPEISLFGYSMSLNIGLPGYTTKFKTYCKVKKIQIDKTKIVEYIQKNIGVIEIR
jgi:ribosomal protein L5